MGDVINKEGHSGQQNESNQNEFSIIRSCHKEHSESNHKNDNCRTQILRDQVDDHGRSKRPAQHFESRFQVIYGCAETHDERRHQKNRRDFNDFCRLDRKSSDIDPASCTIALFKEQASENKQDRKNESRNGKTLVDPIRDV